MLLCLYKSSNQSRQMYKVIPVQEFALASKGPYYRIISKFKLKFSNSRYKSLKKSKKIYEVLQDIFVVALLSIIFRENLGCYNFYRGKDMNAVKDRLSV